jgi:hypothetical protein
MNRPILRPGDEFATKNPMALGALINLCQKVKATDNESEYSHTGIILEPGGTTLESLWTVKSQNLWEAYRGVRVLVVRNINMTPDTYVHGIAKIRKHIGQWYPVHRLLLHLAGLAKFIHWDRVVCSELTAKFECGCAERIGEFECGFLRNWYGVNPDDLADRWRISRYCRTIFEGTVE